MAAAAAALSAAALAAPFPGCKGGTLAGCPGAANCTVKWHEQLIDHFNWAAPLGNAKHTTYQQRYFVNDQWWSRSADGTRGPIFFYFGNEDNVELYVNHTGLMWENAAEFGALLVFAEHRYYGESMPFPSGTPGCMDWLTTEQAMADFAYLIDHLRDSLPGAKGSPVIGFGGSYGGMLGAWFRLKYPNSADGVIAASAPIWSFDGLSPPYDFNAFAQGVTYDTTAAGGATDLCRANLKGAWPRILGAGRSPDGLRALSRAFRTCRPLQSEQDARAVIDWATGPWANMAMGNYPYASTYLMHGQSLLPAWPVRTACKHIDRDFGADDEALFEGVRMAVATQMNNTGDQSCFPITGGGLGAAGPASWAKLGNTVPRARSSTCEGAWGYQWCTEMTQPFVQGTADDFYYCPNGTFFPRVNCSSWDFAGQAANCGTQWNVTPRKEWARIGLGGKRIQDTSNIVFSNGLLDPWHGGGVLRNLSDTLVAVVIPNGAHHIDLMFSDPADAAYPDILAARRTEVAEMRRWVAEAAARRQAP